MSEDVISINDRIVSIATDAILPQLKEMMQLAIEKAYSDLYPPKVIKFNADCFGIDDIERILTAWRDEPGHYNRIEVLQTLPDYEAMWAGLKATIDILEPLDIAALKTVIANIEKAHTPEEFLLEDGKETGGGA